MSFQYIGRDDTSMKDAEKVCSQIISLGLSGVLLMVKPADTSMTAAESVHCENRVLNGDNCPGKPRRMIVVGELLGYLYSCPTLRRYSMSCDTLESMVRV